MRVSIGTVVWAVVVLSVASLMGRVVRVLSIDVPRPTDQHTSNDDSRDKHNDDDDGATDLQLDAKMDHLIWFMQVTDLHLSVFQDARRTSQLRDLCRYTIPAIQPGVVLASGDLTDAKTADMLGSRQYIEEWETYRNILETSGVLNETTWLDIRGNHDNFNVPSLSSWSNYYQQYSVQGRHHQRSYMHTYKRGSDSVAFIAVDACLLPGPRRPFNFVGVLTSSELGLLESFATRAKAEHNHTIWFGHYPTSCIIAPDPGLRKVMSSGLAYMCGHLHTLHGFATHMYTRQQTGALELELGDWKDGRYFRVAAIDHGLFSFVDVNYNVWPVILVTNPKHALFTMPTHEPIHRMANSTHIRVLIWSLSAVVEARVRLDERGSWMELSHIEGPLFVTAWNTQKYSKGLHVLEVFARDTGGRENYISQPFSLDLSQPTFALWPRILLMSNISMVFQFLFGMAICLIVIPLCILRYLHRLVLTDRMNKPRLPRWARMCCCEAVLRKLWILVSINRLFWPIIISTLYYPLGPWMVGEVLENHIGVIFAWGTFVNHSFLPGSLTYGYGFLQMITFHIPLILALSHCADIRCRSFYMESSVSVTRYMCRHVAVLAVITLQIQLIYFFWLAYGTMGLFLGPLRTWAAILGIILWYFAATLPKVTLRPAAKIWNMKTHTISQSDQAEHQPLKATTTNTSSTSNSSGSGNSHSTVTTPCDDNITQL